MHDHLSAQKEGKRRLRRLNTMVHRRASGEMPDLLGSSCIRFFSGKNHKCGSGKAFRLAGAALFG
jgi:hypothetical protein